LLGLLRQKPQHGYDILQNWDKNLGIIWKVKPGRLYAALNKLEQARIALRADRERRKRASPQGIRADRQGESTFSRWLRSPVPSRVNPQEWFAKALFLPGTEPDERQRGLRRADQSRAELAEGADELNLTEFGFRRAGAALQANANSEHFEIFDRYTKTIRLPGVKYETMCHTIPSLRIAFIGCGASCSNANTASCRTHCSDRRAGSGS
jgi:DNA-binding PadR family transcriptional regulator